MSVLNFKLLFQKLQSTYYSLIKNHSLSFRFNVPRPLCTFSQSYSRASYLITKRNTLTVANFSLGQSGQHGRTRAETLLTLQNLSVLLENLDCGTLTKLTHLSS